MGLWLTSKASNRPCQASTDTVDPEIPGYSPAAGLATRPEVGLFLLGASMLPQVRFAQVEEFRGQRIHLGVELSMPPSDVYMEGIVHG